MNLEFASVGDLERDRAFATLLTAFSADPFVRWIYSEASRYLTRRTSRAAPFHGRAFAVQPVGKNGERLDRVLVSAT
jgi:hypothetical protein